MISVDQCKCTWSFSLDICRYVLAAKSWDIKFKLCDSSRLPSPSEYWLIPKKYVQTISFLTFRNDFITKVKRSFPPRNDPNYSQAEMKQWCGFGAVFSFIIRVCEKSQRHPSILSSFNFLKWPIRIQASVRVKVVSRKWRVFSHDLRTYLTYYVVNSTLFNYLIGAKLTSSNSKYVKIKCIFGEGFFLCCYSWLNSIKWSSYHLFSHCENLWNSP